MDILLGWMITIIMSKWCPGQPNRIMVRIQLCSSIPNLVALCLAHYYPDLHKEPRAILCMLLRTVSIIHCYVLCRTLTALYSKISSHHMGSRGSSTHSLFIRNNLGVDDNKTFPMMRCYVILVFNSSSKIYLHSILHFEGQKYKSDYNLGR